MRDVFIQRRQLRPLSGETKRHEGMTNDDWEEFDLLAMSTIILHLAYNAYFTSLGLWLNRKLLTKLWNLLTKLCSTYEKETASNTMYLMRKVRIIFARRKFQIVSPLMWMTLMHYGSNYRLKKSKHDGHAKQSSGRSSSVEMEEISVTCDETDIWS